MVQYARSIHPCMDLTSVFQALFPWVLGVAVLFIIRLIIHQRPQAKSPPGPRPWPVIGNLNLLVGSSSPHESLHLLSQKHGDLMLLHFGSKPVLVASSPETAKLFLKTHDAVFASRPSTAAAKHTFNRSDLTWSPYGSWWRHGRKILLSEVFTPRKLESFEWIRRDERMALISTLYNFAVGKKPVLLRDHLVRFTLSTATRLVSSHKYYNNNLELRGSVTMKKLQGFLDEWFLLNGAFNLGDWVPWLSHFDLQGYVKRMRALSYEYEEFMEFLIEDHRDVMNKAGEKFVPKDMVDIFLQLADDPNLEPEAALTPDRIKGLIHDMLAGGSDTSAAAVEWAFQEMLRNPSVVEKATEELDRVIGRERWVEEKDFPQLPYVEAIIKEALRLHPLCTLLPPHYSLEDCNVAGYEVARGTTVLVNVWSIGRNPKYWERAEEFYPERFLEREVDLNKGQDFALLPFGSGRRKCPGYRLGMKIVRGTLANLLHGFSWKLAGDMKPNDVSLETVYGLTTHPKFPLSFIIQPRLPAHLY